MLVKILYIIPEGEDDAGLGERLWAEPLGNGLYRLQNIPVFAEHFSVEDVVQCDESVQTLPVIHHLHQRSGNRTLRVEFLETTSAEQAVDEVIMPFSNVGIVYEKAGPRRYMFNVPADADYMWAHSLLLAKEQAGLLWVS